MKRLVPFIVMGLFVVIQVMYYLGIFRGQKNRLIPMFLFLSLSAVAILIAYLVD